MDLHPYTNMSAGLSHAMGPSHQRRHIQTKMQQMGEVLSFHSGGFTDADYAARMIKGQPF